jgi:hypothetical protein
MTDPMGTMVMVKDKLETRVFLPAPVYQKIPITLFVIGTVILAGAFYFRNFHSWSVLYFSCGMVSCMYGTGLYMYRKGMRTPSNESE